ncbi:uncharacterized protein BT62DRAFT_796409 [Guyanagaster necrorhizus]|uniref:Uncharacterized protein n=1 Tax=Guyanagaster necrorhizus TaxID=856835 RepID=A0A9P8ATW8_9AGAR|nr:uncharacterized protein BT62DRAFT_796409 [Guyanagaster necrorhizus MCA 3950]KAG7447859.1 hypothetical protein BT62DRAFT_796409 [Guyanagaster necrorhizus MCA 3950]
MRSKMLVFMIYIIPPLGAYDMDSIQMLVAFGARSLHFRGPSLDDPCIGRGTGHQRHCCDDDFSQQGRYRQTR